MTIRPPPAWGLEKLGHAIHQIGSRAPNEYWHKDASIRGVPQIRRIGIGTGVGFLFAVFALAISVVSFPMLLDRDVSLEVAIRTSIAMVTTNPGPMAAWGSIVAAGLVLGSLPALVGLVVVMPILGHATWHLYRHAVPR